MKTIFDDIKAVLSSIWKSAVGWFENSDLVPLLVLVSAVHYAAVLAGKDWWPVAVAIGLLVDLGHYRTIRAAVRYGGDKWYQHGIRWGIAIGMTAVSLSYHQRYYQDWWLSAPLPLLIAALAWLQQVEPKAKEPKSDNAPSVRIMRPQQTALPPVENVPLLPENTHNATHPAHNYACSACGQTFERSTELANHKRWQHSKKEVDA